MSWNPWNWLTSSKVAESTAIVVVPKPEVQHTPREPPKQTYTAHFERLRKEAGVAIQSIHAWLESAVPVHCQPAIAGTVVATAVSTLVTRHLYVRYICRIPSTQWVDYKMIHRKKWIKGYVTSANDGDNFLLYHTPGIGFLWPLKLRRLPSGPRPPNQTIRIRLAGVDSPEGNHFGRPAQPYAAESKAWLKRQVENKFIWCQLLGRDHYGRIVARAHLKPRLVPCWLAKGKCVSLAMLQAGWGTVYRQANAAYGLSGLDEFERAEREARSGLVLPSLPA